MIYAGVDVAKANHVIGAVGDDGQPLCKSMEFKNSDAGFEVLGVAGGPGRGAVGRLRRHGGHWALLDGPVRMGLPPRATVCVINPMEVKAVRKPGASRRSKRSGRRAAHRRDLAHRRGTETKLASDEVQFAPHAHPLPPGDQEAGRPGQDSADLRHGLLLPESTPAFSPDMFGSASLAVLEKSPMPSELLRRKAPSLASDISKVARAADRAGQGVRAWRPPPNPASA